MRLKTCVLTLTVAAGFGLASTQFATAADMAMKAPPRNLSPVLYNWSGMYIGGNVGYAQGTSKWVDDPTLGASNLGSHNPRGGFGGLQVGYDWQYSLIVLGLEADAAWASIKGNHVDQFLHNLNTKVTSFGTVTGRLGFAYWDSVLFYGKGGLAWANFKYDDFTSAGALNGRVSVTTMGWTLGGGVEYGFQRNWSAKLEYNYLHFNTRRNNFSGGFVQDIAEQLHVIKAGVNYRFGL